MATTKKSTKKAPKAEAKAKRKAPEGTEFRVVPLSFATRNALAERRLSSVESNRQLVAATVDQRLPEIVATLKSLGFGQDGGPSKKYRMHFESRTIQELREASQALDVPATTLLQLCLQPQPAKRKGGRK